MPVNTPKRTHHALTRSLRPHVHVAVIGVASKRISALLKFLVDFIEKHVCKHRREWSTLRRSILPFHHHARRHNAGSEVAADESQHAAVRDPFRKLAHQHIVIDAVEEFLEIHVDHPSAAFLSKALRRSHCVVRSLSTPEAVAVLREARIDSRLQHSQYALLNESVDYGWLL